MLTGGCLCGRIRYAVSAYPIRTALCHCTHCQRQSGSAYSIVAVVPAASVTITGSPATFQDQGESGAAVLRKFCRDCGSPILSQIPDRADVLFIKAGTLDDASAITPEAHIWCRSALPWLPLEHGLPQFERGYGSDTFTREETTDAR